jgi:hypothetical protein
MPENKDHMNTLDQDRPGAPQTKESGREGQGTAKQRTTDGSLESGGEQGQFSDEEKLREIGKNSNHPGNPAEEWSPGTHQPNT